MHIRWAADKALLCDFRGVCTSEEKKSRKDICSRHDIFHAFPDASRQTKKKQAIVSDGDSFLAPGWTNVLRRCARGQNEELTSSRADVILSLVVLTPCIFMFEKASVDTRDSIWRASRRRRARARSRPPPGPPPPPYMVKAGVRYGPQMVMDARATNVTSLRKLLLAARRRF